MNMYIYLIYIFIFSLLMFFMSIYFMIFKLCMYLEMELLNLNSMKMEILIYLDWMFFMFVSVVMIISSMVILYSIKYMEGDIFINRFMYLILLFVLSMILMMLSPNMISILLGWDGLGLISYCLVIYYQSMNSYNSGMVTVLTNRLGDIFILILIGLLMFLGSWNFMFFYKLDEILMLMVIFISFTKSAQIPFSSWLPLAMAAPTPVSSLVHSSTLVTAGVYLLIRFNYLMLGSYKILMTMMFFSLITMFLSGLGANFEFDLKKIIALSTLSQLGLMIFCLSLGEDLMSFFHLLIHALFKSMLFMCAGVIIHNMMGFQDIRFISMTLFNMPLVSMMFNCSSVSLCGIPFMSGFFSKDLILEIYLMNFLNKFILLILFMSMGFTIMYTLRLVYYSFIKVSNLNLYTNNMMINNLMVLSMMILFLFSIIMGLILSWIIFSMKNLIILTKKMKLLIYMFMLMGCIFSFIFQKIYLSKFMIEKINILIKFNMMLWFMPLIYMLNIKYLMKFNNKMIYLIEFGWGEYFWGKNLISMIKSLFKIDFILKNYFFLFMVVSFMILMMFLN